MKNYEIKEEEMEGTKIIKSAYNLNGDYIGSPETAEMLFKRGINPELSDKDSKTCSIGFCEKEQKWYGWSHRAIYGFGIGHIVKKGNSEATFGVIPEAITDKERAIVMSVVFECKNLDDCKRCAIAFAESIS